MGLLHNVKAAVSGDTNHISATPQPSQAVLQTTGDQWSTGINLANWTSWNQLQDLLDTYNSCAVANIAAIAQWMTGIRKTPDEVLSDGWQSTYQGPIDYPPIETYATGWMTCPTQDYHPAHPADMATLLYQITYWKRVALYLCSLDGIHGHWCTVLVLQGTVGSKQPFDVIWRNNPWGGYVESLSYQEWQDSLFRYQGDGNFLLVDFQRTRSITVNRQMGPG